uniref:Protein kinase domain-containing protein n=1 Tax=Gouania willdenowi TaxID=441366 RepID=A0A8C5GZ89_GOUWI
MLLLLRTFSFGPSTRYTILEFIGEGTFGKVAKCRAHNSSKLVAVKILKSRLFIHHPSNHLSTYVLFFTCTQV